MSDDLGRIVTNDVRDFDYRMESVLPERSPKGLDFRNWDNCHWIGDQKGSRRCVGYAFTSWYCEQVTHTSDFPPIDPDGLYYDCKIAENEAGSELGTSVRTAAKIMHQKGMIHGYYWGFDAGIVARALLTTGPVVVGTNWYADMDRPGKNALLAVSGKNRGGHAYLIDGYSRTKKLFRIKNSRGREWGEGGRAYMWFEDLDRLIRERGEVCLPIR